MRKQKNKFTLIKRDMLEVWEEENGKERFRELFKGSPKDFLRALEKIVSIMPRENMVDIDGEIAPVIVYQWAEGNDHLEEI